MRLAIFLKWKGNHTAGLGINKKLLDKLRQKLPWTDIEVAETPDGKDLIQKNFLAEIVMAYDGDPAFLQYCLQDPALLWIHNVVSGSEHILNDLYLRSINGLTITNSRGIQGKPMADHIMGAILFFLREYGLYLENQKKHLWETGFPEETEGKTISIIGLGNIGRELARRAKAFNMRVIGVKRVKEDIPFVDQIYLTDDINRAAEQADFLVLLTPASSQTYHLINKEIFALMKPSAYFINVSRGSCCDSHALYEALHTRRIKGALIDTYDLEPIPKNDPIWNLDNVIITPHMAAVSPLYMERMTDLFIENAKQFKAGIPLSSRINA